MVPGRIVSLMCHFCVKKRILQQPDRGRSVGISCRSRGTPGDRAVGAKEGPLGGIFVCDGVYGRFGDLLSHCCDSVSGRQIAANPSMCSMNLSLPCMKRWMDLGCLATSSSLRSEHFYPLRIVCQNQDVHWHVRMDSLVASNAIGVQLTVAADSMSG